MEGMPRRHYSSCRATREGLTDATSATDDRAAVYTEALKCHIRARRPVDTAEPDLRALVLRLGPKSRGTSRYVRAPGVPAPEEGMLFRGKLYMCRTCIARPRPRGEHAQRSDGGVPSERLIYTRSRTSICTLANRYFEAFGVQHES